MTDLMLGLMIFMGLLFVLILWLSFKELSEGHGMRYKITKGKNNEKNHEKNNICCDFIFID